MEGPSPLDPRDPNIPSRHLEGKTQISEKPLPSPPSSADYLQSKALASRPSPSTAESTPSGANRPSLTGQPSFQRPNKKRVPWGNKSCMIALPLENEDGRRTTRESYLKAEEVGLRLKDWEEAGFNTKGFVLASPSTESEALLAQGQSRTIHPDIKDQELERSHRVYRVNIPDRRDWEAYVNNLKEEKLRALGVSFGDTDPPSRKSPAPSLMSRGASSQGSSMLVSPPLAPTAVGSLAFPAHFQDPSTVNTLPAHPRVSHFPRYSMATPFGDKILPTPQFPQSPSPGHGAWSPQQYLSSQPNSRIGSPVGNGLVHNMGTAFTSAPPMVLDTNSHPNSLPESNDMLARMHNQQSQLQAQHMRQLPNHHQPLQPRPLSDTSRVHNVDVHPGRAHDSNHIASPAPRGHRKNPSESLQREVDEADSLVKAGNKENLASEILSKDAIPGTTQDKGVTKTQAKLSQLDDAQMELDSSSQTPDEVVGHAEVSDRPTSNNDKRLSTSKLNVNAPEFKLVPNQSSAPSVYAFMAGQQSQAGHISSIAPLGVLPKARIPSGPAQTSTLNVAAPVFTPQSAPKPKIPSREFSFSSAGPSFNPDAPTFKPAEDVKILSANSTSASDKENPIAAVKKIFGEIKLPEVVKPTRESQALPIVQPEGIPGTNHREIDGQEDESGRITQADGRQKRARRDQDDGDQVPLFASPKHSPWMDAEKDDRAAYFGNESSSESEEAEPTTIEAATDLLEEVLDDMSASERSSLMRESKESELPKTTKHGYAFQDVDQAASYNAALPPVFLPQHQATGNDPSPQEIAEATKDFLARSSQYKTEFDRALVRGVSEARSVSPLSPVSGDNRHFRQGEKNQFDRTDHASPARLRQDILDGVRYVEPTYDEIDTVMKHVDNDLDAGVERRISASGQRSSAMLPKSPRLDHRDTRNHHQLLPHTQIRSDAPSPSPNRLRNTIQHLPSIDSESANTTAMEMVARNARFSPSYRPSRSDPHVQRLNSPGSTPPSDWNDAISSTDEDKFHSRTSLFDNRIDGLVEDTVQKRLDQRLKPMEKMLSGMYESLVKLSSRSTSRRPRSSGTLALENSDADDEDDDEEAEGRSHSRLGSRQRDRKIEQLKSSIHEVATAQQKFAPATQLAEVMDAVKDVRSSLEQASAGRSTPLGDIKGIVEEAVGKQMRGRSAPVTSTSHAAAAEKSALQIAGLESMLKIAEGRASDEMKARRSTEDALADNQRLLRTALQEAAEQRESAEATERSLQDYHGEQHQLLKRMASLEGSQEHMEKMASDLLQKNTALEGTLQEYRLSSDQWRTEIDDARHENKDLKRQLQSLKIENGGLHEDRLALRTKFDHLEEDLHSASRELATDQAKWQNKEEGHRDKLDMLGARLEAEARTRERLELEIERLEAQEKESMKARYQVEQIQKTNDHLDKLVGQLRSESHEHQNKSTRLERDLHAAKETHMMELHRTRSEMKADMEGSKSQASVVHADLQSVIARLEKRSQDSAADAETASNRHELMLEEAAESRHAALREAAEAREAALQEHYRFHERILAEDQSQHQRAIDNLLADKERSETYFGNRLSIADEKAAHYQDRITHLEDKLEVAKEAANAAVQAAKTRKADHQNMLTQSPASPPRSIVTSSIPAKVSPQALRESILVLQEQLQARESRIEELEAQISTVDTAAPAKLKEADVEITWLRELLGVRVDDLEDIIAILSQPMYDREAVKAAAIRLKANLQMEQQEKERALAGGSGQTFPSLSTLTASPRALPLAAAAAWGNWRKGRDSTFGNLGAIANGSAHQTPSKSSTPQSLFAGLMTPPSTNMRTTPQPDTRPSSSNSRPLMGRGQVTPRQSLGLREGSKRPSIGQAGPVTPPLNLMRQASYDLDAREGPRFGAEEGQDVQTDGGDDFGGKYEFGPGEDEEPFGPRIGTFSS